MAQNSVLVFQHTGQCAFFKPLGACTFEHARKVGDQYRAVFERFAAEGKPSDGTLVLWHIPEPDCTRFFMEEGGDIAEQFPKSSVLIEIIPFYGDSAEMLTQLIEHGQQ